MGNHLATDYSRGQAGATAGQIPSHAPVYTAQISIEPSTEPSLAPLVPRQGISGARVPLPMVNVYWDKAMPLLQSLPGCFYLQQDSTLSSLH